MEIYNLLKNDSTNSIALRAIGEAPAAVIGKYANAPCATTNIERKRKGRGDTRRMGNRHVC